MNDKYNSVHAAGSLAKIGTPRAIEAVKKSGPDVIRAFKEAMFAMQPEVREEVAIALKAIDSEETRRILGRYS